MSTEVNKQNIEAAARRVTAAFDARCNALNAPDLLMACNNFEIAMVALKEALQGGAQPATKHLWDGSPWPNYRVTCDANTEVDRASRSGRTQS